MPHDSPHEPVESEFEHALAPRPLWIGVEPSPQRQKWYDERRRNEHHHRPHARHDAEVVHRSHTAGDERAEADHVGGDRSDHRPKQDRDGAFERRSGGQALLPLPPKLHDHVHDGGDRHHRDHCREHGGDHRQLEADHGQHAPRAPECQEHDRQRHDEPAEAAEGGEQDRACQDRAGRAQEIAVTLQHREPVAEHHRLPCDGARGQVGHRGAEAVDRIGTKVRLWPRSLLRRRVARRHGRRLQHADDRRRAVVGANGIPFQEFDEPPRRGACFDLDDAVAQRRIGEARGRGDARERSERVGERAELFDARCGEEFRVVVGRQHQFARTKRANHSTVWHQRRIGAVEHRVDRTDEFESPRLRHGQDRDHHCKAGQRRAVTDQPTGDTIGNRLHGSKFSRVRGSGGRRAGAGRRGQPVGAAGRARSTQSGGVWYRGGKKQAGQVARG